MKKEVIKNIRNILDFMEEFDTLVSKARENGDVEREDDLHAALGRAEYSLRDLVESILGDRQKKKDQVQS